MPVCCVLTVHGVCALQRKNKTGTREQSKLTCTTEGAMFQLPEHGKRFVAAASNQRHLNALSSNLVTVKATDCTDCLLQRQHVNRSLQLIIGVGAELHSFHLDKTSHTTVFNNTG